MVLLAACETPNITWPPLISTTTTTTTTEKKESPMMVNLCIYILQGEHGRGMTARARQHLHAFHHRQVTSVAFPARDMHGPSEW